MAHKMKTYYDESGTKHLLGALNSFEEDITAEMAAVRAANAAEEQNRLYEKEISEIHRNGTIAKWAAIASAVASGVTMLITILG